MSIKNVHKSDEFPNFTTAEVVRSTAGRSIFSTACQKRSEEKFVVDHQQRMERLYRRAKELNCPPANGTGAIT